jgi:hypothetical protein
MVWTFLESRQVFKFDKFSATKIISKFKNLACVSSEKVMLTFSATFHKTQTLHLLTKITAPSNTATSDAQRVIFRFPFTFPWAFSRAVLTLLHFCYFYTKYENVGWFLDGLTLCVMRQNPLN